MIKSIDTAKASFKPAGVAKKGKVAKTDLEKLAEKDKLMTPGGALQWWSQIEGDMMFLDRHRPRTGTIVKDIRNGRFLITYLGHSRVSIAWGNRGMPRASAMVLKQLWQWHTDATGGQCPLPI